MIEKNNFDDGDTKKKDGAVKEMDQLEEYI